MCSGSLKQTRSLLILIGWSLWLSYGGDAGIGGAWWWLVMIGGLSWSAMVFWDLGNIIQ
jgi:hypothetical protein